MGRVYRARDTRLDRDVAIKFLRNEFLRNPERLGGLIDEARAASALNHPNILTVHEIGEVEGTPFIAMEFVDGDTLRQRLRAGPPPVGDALDMMLQVGEALEAARARGIVHGDIKPENVMIRRDGYIKLLDFGLATVPREIDERGRLVPGTPTVVSVAGTPGYASPEQLERRPVDQRSDIFSFGVLLCELVTGTNPLGQPTLLEMANPIAQTPAPAKPPIASLPKEVAAIVATAIEKNPDQRYQTMAELVGDLRSARSQADPSSQPSRATPPMAQARRGLAWAFRLALRCDPASSR
jgi:serine/threonine protein kinase